MRRPVDAPYTLGDGDAAHAARGIGPAQDYGVPVGTPVRAMFAVVRTVKSGGPTASGGHTLTGYAANGDYWCYQHLSEWTTAAAAEGAVVAQSGNSGTATSGPHLHAYAVIGGTRINPETLLASTAATSGSEDTEMSTAALDNIAQIASEIRNLILDPTVGLGVRIDAARASADNGAQISSEIRNWIIDPNIGILAKIGTLTTGTVDVSALAAQLREALGDAVADELAKRLAG